MLNGIEPGADRCETVSPPSDAEYTLERMQSLIGNPGRTRSLCMRCTMPRGPCWIASGYHTEPSESELPLANLPSDQVDQSHREQTNVRFNAGRCSLRTLIPANQIYNYLGTLYRHFLCSVRYCRGRGSNYLKVDSSRSGNDQKANHPREFTHPTGKRKCLGQPNGPWNVSDKYISNAPDPSGLRPQHLHS